MLGLARKSPAKIISPIFLTLTLLFLYFPIVVLVIFSFNAKVFPSPWHSFTLEWYYKLFSNNELWLSFSNSCIVATGSTFICLLLSICMLYFLSKGGRVEKMIPLFYGNLVIPETVLAIGLINYFTLLHIPLGLLTIIVAHSIVGLGFVIPILYVRYRDLDPKIFEASRVLGASYFETFTRITLPLMRPTLIAAGLMIFMISFDDFILSYFCSGTSQQTLSLFLVSSIRYGISPIINALASILLLFTMTLLLLFFSLKQRTRIL